MKTKETIMAKTITKKAKEHLTKLRKLISKRKHSFSDMTEDEVIETLRKTREDIWDKKLVTHS